jgi:hypothetical protein
MAPNAPVAPTSRSPEEVRLMLSRYRSGLHRARTDETDDRMDDDRVEP